MHQPFRRFVTKDDYLDDESSLAAYSKDCSSLTARPRVVVRPKNLEELRRIIVHAGTVRTPLVPRGTGTGVRGGVVLRDACIIHLHHFNNVCRVDTQLDLADVEAGISVQALNKKLERFGLSFPLIPENPLASLGGLAAINAVTMESHLFGSMLDNIEWVEAFDGVGRLEKLKGERRKDVIGWEGCTGIITKLRLRLKRKTRIASIEIIEGVNEKRIKEEVKRRGSRAAFLEYTDILCSRALGLKPAPHLIMGFLDHKGSYQNPVRVEQLVKRLRSLGNAFPPPEDFIVDEQSLFGLLSLCERLGVPVRGHIGIGVLIAHALPAQRRDFIHKALSVGARPGGKYGFGRLNKEFIPYKKRSEAIRIKEKRDYRGILNPGIF